MFRKNEDYENILQAPNKISELQAEVSLIDKCTWEPSTLAQQP